MSIALGNQKPEQLLEVEKLIWRALITLSLGMTPPENVLGDLVLNIPWGKLQPPSHQDSEWFITQATPVSAASTQNTLQAPSILPVVSDINDTGTLTAHGNTSPRQPPPATASPVSDNNAMDKSLDNQTQSPPLATASPVPDNNAMDETPDYEFPPLPTALPLPDNNAIDQSPDYQPQSPTLTSPQPMEQSLEVPTFRRSTRLALENSKEDTLHHETPENRSTSVYSSKRRPPTALKRKAPTGEAEVRKSPFAGGSRASPIDVDALHAVLERYPLKREPQVRGSSTLYRIKADDYSSY